MKRHAKQKAMVHRLGCQIGVMYPRLTAKKSEVIWRNMGIVKNIMAGHQLMISKRGKDDFTLAYWRYKNVKT